MTKQGLVSWRCLHQPCWQAFFSPAFWLGTPSGRSFPPAVGREPADAVISNDLTAAFLLRTPSGCESIRRLVEIGLQSNRKIANDTGAKGSGCTRITLASRCEGATARSSWWSATARNERLARTVPSTRLNEASNGMASGCCVNPRRTISDPFSPNENRTTRVMPAWRRTSMTTLVDSGVNASKMPQLVKVSRSVICCAKSLIVRADLTGPSL